MLLFNKLCSPEQELLQEHTGIIKSQGKIILRGVRQGDPIFPKLFTATVQVFKNAQLKIGIDRDGDKHSREIEQTNGMRPIFSFHTQQVTDVQCCRYLLLFGLHHQQILGLMVFLHLDLLLSLLVWLFCWVSEFELHISKHWCFV